MGPIFATQAHRLIELRKLRKQMKQFVGNDTTDAAKALWKDLTDFLNFKLFLLQLSLYIQQNSLCGIRKKSLHCITRAQLTQG